MKKLAGFLLAAALLALPVQAAESMTQSLADSGYTYYVIDADGQLCTWGDSYHREVGLTD